MSKEAETDTGDFVIGEGSKVPPKLAQVLGSRKVWAGVIGMAATLTLWWLGEIDGARAVEALTWVLGIFIGSVALEDGMARLFGVLGQGVERGSGERE